MNRARCLLTALLLFLFCLVRGQDYSNKGKDFWLAYPAHIDGDVSRMALYVSADINTSGTVFLNGTSISFSVTANQATVVQIFPTTYPVINSQNEGIKGKSGIHIVSNDPVVVYAHILNQARSGSSLILPTKTLGREYIATSFRSMGNSTAGGPNGSPSGSQFTIVGVEDNTTVEITPSTTDVAGTRPAGVVFTVTLNQGDVYQFRTTFDKDVTGTKIRSLATNTSSCKPIAVFSGSSWTSMDCSGASGGDNLFQQLMPINAWGKNYITAPFADRQYDIFRIVVTDATTQVVLNGSVLPTSSLVNNTYYQFSGSTPNVISSDKPIMVVQYMISQTCDTRNNGSTGATAPYPGDPEMIILNPIEQTINDVTVVSARRDLTPPATSITKHFFTIIVKTSSFSSLTIDGAPPVASPIPIGGTAYCYVQENVTASTNVNPSHRIKADSGFIALAYGLGSVESYGYNAGTNVKDLYQFVTIQNQFGTVNFPSTCKNAPFYFSMTFPYQPTSINWVFGPVLNAMGINDIVLTSPQYDSTWTVNGKQLFRYRLSTPYIINAVGIYPIKVVAQNPTTDGCNGEQEINYDVQVFERPAANFSFTTSGCVSDSVRFTDISNTYSRPTIKWFWNFDDGQTSPMQNPAHLFSSANPYNVKFSVVTDIGCVSDTVVKQVALTQPPLAGFVAVAPYCAGATITLNDSSISASAPIIKWTWNFGDGSAVVVSSTNASQSHSYATTGSYVVTLSVETASGCKSAVFSKTITVSPNPVANFGFGRECLPNGSVTFTDATTISGNVPNSFSYGWKFGDGGVSSLKNPAHNYTAIGPYTAMLTVMSSNGCKDSVAKIIDSVYAQPLANFTVPAEVCFGASVNLTDQSTSANSTVTTWAWSFGDGATSSQQNPSHTFSSPGTYTVQLSVASVLGCQSTVFSKQIVVNPLPTADFSPSLPTCVSRTVTFNDKSTANAGSLSKWTWNFGDGSAVVIAASNVPQTHTYTSVGTYTVTLQVETGAGCVSTAQSKQVVISPLPVPAFITPGNCVNDPLSQFLDTSSIADGTQGQFTYMWSFGDANSSVLNPNTSTLKNATHKFIATGNYNVRLTVTSNNGCVDSVTQVFTINGAVPVSTYAVQGGLQHCSNDSVFITDNSSVFPGKLVKLEIYWDYNGNPSNKVIVNNPVPGTTYHYKYPEFFTPDTQTFRVKMVAYSGLNCLSEKDTFLVVKATPDINYPAVASVCADAPSFQIVASVANTTGTGVFSGKGVDASGLFNPLVAGTGTYPIRYTYTGLNGCSNFKEQTVSVYPVPTVNAGPDKYVLEGGSATLTATAGGNGFNYLWTPATYLNSASIIQPVSTPADDITYSLTVTSADGCSASDQVFVKLLKAPTIPNVFTPNGDGINDQWVILYLESYPGATVDIFNRYGSLVYHSLGYPKPWDGTYNGKPMPAGTYYYIINPKNGRKQITGFVDIVR